MKTKNGITLIALIITIIVMLILVGVTINLAANGGLFEKSRTASKDTEQKKILEELIAMAEFDNDGKINVDSLIGKVTEKYVGSDYDTNSSKLTVKGNKGEFYYKVTETEIKIWEENDGGNDNPDTKTLSELYCNDENCTNEAHLHKGDYVNYTPTTAQAYAPDKGEGIGKYTGYTEGESEQSIPQGSLNWRVLGKDTNGNILLISGAPTDAKLAFYGYVGYNNYEDVLNDTCNALYSNTELGATARSITMDDIDTYLGGSNYDKMTYGGSEGTYGYQNENEITSKFRCDKNILTKEDCTIPVKGLKSNSCLYFVTSNSDIGAKNREILLGETRKFKYWIASRAVNVHSNCAVWGMNFVDAYSNSVGDYGRYFCHSNGNEYSMLTRLRPVVSLPSSITTDQVSKTNA